MNGHNKIASFYDVLAFAVFGKRIEKASKLLALWLDTERNILILGGGTGKILEFLKKEHHVHYVDNSQKMIARAKKRDFKCSVNFDCRSFNLLDENKTYDAIICPFFLDVFGSNELKSVVDKIKRHSGKTTKLFVADFDTRFTHWLNQSIMKLMLWFFFQVKAIPKKQFNALFQYLESRNDLERLDIKEQQQGFIVSAKYKFI